ncbi:hypothetical protein JCM12294_35180 [Desulfocicer niacini]
MPREQGGTSVAHALICLWTITGNIDVPGGNVIARPSHGLLLPLFHRRTGRPLWGRTGQPGFETPTGIFQIYDGEWIYIKNDMGRVKRKVKITRQIRYNQHI